MRIACLVLVTAPIAGCSMDSHSPLGATQLYRRVKEQLLSARTVVVESTFREKDASDYWMWELSRDSDRFRVDGRCSRADFGFFWKTISDGRRTYSSPARNFEIEGVEVATPNEANRVVERFMDVGVGAIWLGPQGKSVGELELKDLREDVPVVIKNRICQVLRYQMIFRGTDDGFNVILWIDRETLLPVKREYKSNFTVSQNSKLAGVNQEGEEVYVRILLNSEIDANRFKLPGE
jgi:hypothetical protein